VNTDVDALFVRPKRMAQLLGISIRTLQNWRNLKLISSTTVNRVVLYDPVKVKAEVERLETRGVA